MALEYVIYCDESAAKGRYYSNFYGGALVRSTDELEVTEAIRSAARGVNLTSEIKWHKVTEQYFAKYVAVVDAIFDLVGADKLKLRVMFTSNRFQPINLTREQRDGTYLRLYYQFIKHAFGLQYSNTARQPIRVRLNLDVLPDKKDACASFKAYLAGLTHWHRFQEARISIEHEAIAEVDSKQHVILQALDVVLGAMNSRLNDLHLEKPEGAAQRGSRTLAKEKLYKHILARIQRIYPNFNIGISTGTRSIEERWLHPYRHWLFMPSEHEIDNTRKKP